MKKRFFDLFKRGASLSSESVNRLSTLEADFADLYLLLEDRQRELSDLVTTVNRIERRQYREKDAGEIVAPATAPAPRSLRPGEIVPPHQLAAMGIYYAKQAPANRESDHG